MGVSNAAIEQLAAAQWHMVSLAQLADLGVGSGLADRRVAAGRWLRIHPGVYQLDKRRLTWEASLMAAVLACGSQAMVSHRAAFKLWGLDGLRTTLVEVTVPYSSLPTPEGVLVHRTRRSLTRASLHGIPVSTVERTLLDASSLLPARIVAKGLDSAIRHRVTTPDKVYDLLVEKGGRGVQGTRRLRLVLKQRIHDTATGSGSEFDLLYHMQMAFLPRPELQYPLLADGRRVPDFYWPTLNKAVEVDGVDAHGSADQLDDDLQRQNALMDLGVELRRFSARRVHRDPKGVVAEISAFLSQ